MEQIRDIVRGLDCGVLLAATSTYFNVGGDLTQLKYVTDNKTEFFVEVTYLPDEDSERTLKIEEYMYGKDKKPSELDSIPPETYQAVLLLSAMIGIYLSITYSDQNV